MDGVRCEDNSVYLQIKLFLTKVVFSKVQSRNLGRRRYDVRSNSRQLQVSSGSLFIIYILYINKFLYLCRI
jgi:hypothetical protein